MTQTMTWSWLGWPSRTWVTLGTLGICSVGVAGCGGSPEGDGNGAELGGMPPGGTGTPAGGAGSGLTPVGAGSESTSAPPLSPVGSGGQPAGSGGAAMGGSGATPASVPSDGRPVCAKYPVRSDGLLLDFDTYDVMDGSWGESGLGQLTGGTSGYSCADDGVSCPVSAIIARVRTGGGGLRIQAAVPSQGYTGMVLWFGPCVDASAFGGLTFQVSGELFGAELSVKLQTHENYPIDLVNAKGGCEYTAEATKWSECVPPAYAINTTSAQPTAVSLLWSDFVNGLPNDGVAPDGIVGLELQFNCPTDVDCAMDVRIGELRFTP
jgi:hypothetical protein